MSTSPRKVSFSIRRSPITQNIEIAIETECNAVAIAASEEGGCPGLTYRLNGSNVIPEAKFESQMLSYNVLSKLAGLYVSDGIGEGPFNA
jgi:hypothetical protein